MTVVSARITVTSDGTISISAPLPAGEYEAAIKVDSAPLPGKPFTMQDFPRHDAAWDRDISLRREDLYDDDGRLR